MAVDPCEGSLTVPLTLGETQSTATPSGNPKDLESNFSRPIAGSTSSFKTFFNGLNALSGVGILSTPYALASGGWLSLVLLFITAIAAFYSGLLIQRCMDADPDIRTYPDMGARAFGKKGRILASAFMNTELYLVATGFLILEGDNLNDLFPNTGFEISGIEISGEKFFVLIAALIILPTVWLDSLSILSFVSATGVLASAVILGSVLWAATFGGIGFHGKSNLIQWNGIPTAISLYGFCYCAHPVFPTLYTSINNKRQFSTVLLFCFIFCTATYASMAIIGYLMFGAETQSQITLNLPTRIPSSKVAIFTTLVNPITKYALMVTPIVNALKYRFSHHGKQRFTSLLISTTFVISTVIVALAVPFFGHLMSLVGAFLSITASIVLPCLCYLKISGTYQRFGGEFVFICGIILMGLVIIITGTYTSLVKIVGNYVSH